MGLPSLLGRNRGAGAGSVDSLFDLREPHFPRATHHTRLARHPHNQTRHARRTAEPTHCSTSPPKSQPRYSPTSSATARKPPFGGSEPPATNGPTTSPLPPAYADPHDAHGISANFTVIELSSSLPFATSYSKATGTRCHRTARPACVGSEITRRIGDLPEPQPVRGPLPPQTVRPGRCRSIAQSCGCREDPLGGGFASTSVRLLKDACVGELGVAFDGRYQEVEPKPDAYRLSLTASA